MSAEKLPKGWVETQLENIVDILDSMRVPVNNSERQSRIAGKKENELYPYFGATGEVGKIDDYIFDEELVALGEDGVPFFDGHKNKAYMLYGKTWVNNHAHVIRAISGLSHNKYLCHYLNQFDYHDYVNGGTRLKLTQANMRKLPVSLAPLAEQKIIAEKLDTLLAQVDSTKARLEQIPQILKRFRQAVLAAAVNGHLNKTAQSNTKKRTLQEVGIIIKTGPFGSALHKSDYISNGIPVINPMHINDGIISPSLSMTISDEKYAELSSWSLQDGDIIVGRRGEMGRAAVVNIGQSKMLCGTGSMILRTKKNIEPRYLELILRSPTAISYFNKEAVGSTMVNLNQKVINSLEAYIPNVEEQREIVRRVEQLFAYADTIEKQVNNALARVNNLTQSILAKAFRGELTAQWRAENPDLISGENRAAVLLEKIKAERAASGGKKASRKKS